MVAFLNQPLWRLLKLYGALYAGFGVQSPYLPSFLENRGLAPEAIGTMLAAGTAIRLLAGWLADTLDAPNAVLAACSLSAAPARSHRRGSRRDAGCRCRRGPLGDNGGGCVASGPCCDPATTRADIRSVALDLHAASCSMRT
jgi:hypothetical protein